MRIAVDAFGGDLAPVEAIKGGVAALKKNKDFTLVLVGKRDIIEDELTKYDYDERRVEILSADDVITNDDSPTQAISKKPESSIVVGLTALRRKEVDAFVSAGSTGAVLAGSLLKVGRIKGISRPGLLSALPTLTDKEVYFMDCGANVDSKPINICQFAIMATAYAEAVSGIKNPTVALLSNGTEDKKGDERNHETFPLLKDMKDINFIGNIEARDILSGHADVIVTDGFGGNIALKSIEGAVGAILSLLKADINSSFRGKMGGLMLKPSFVRLKNKLDYNKKGGAVFLGASGVVIKAHGSSKSSAFENAVLQAVSAVNGNLVETIEKKVAAKEFVEN